VDVNSCAPSAVRTRVGHEIILVRLYLTNLLLLSPLGGRILLIPLIDSAPCYENHYLKLDIVYYNQVFASKGLRGVDRLALRGTNRLYYEKRHPLLVSTSPYDSLF
jgi:hypothetical protein